MPMPTGARAGGSSRWASAASLTVPGSHLRRINESDTGRYQNLRGQDRLACPAVTVVLLHHGLWHEGRRNDSDA